MYFKNMQLTYMRNGMTCEYVEDPYCGELDFEIFIISSWKLVSKSKFSLYIYDSLMYVSIDLNRNMLIIFTI